MRKPDRRWSSSRNGWLAAIVMSLVSVPVLGASPADPAEPVEGTAVEADARAPGPAGSTEASVEAMAGYTWQLLSHEYCLDRFGTTCPNGATSADPCPVSNPQGKPCSLSGDRCWHVLSTWWADEYRCQWTP